MPKNQNANVLVRLSGNKLAFPPKVNWSTFDSFRDILDSLSSRPLSNLLLDFTAVETAYPDGMVPLISTLENSFLETELEIRGPRDNHINELFEKNGWFHYISSRNNPVSTNRFEYNLHRFRTDVELNDTTNYLLNWVLQAAEFAKGVPQAFEWMVNELSGNVLVHAEADHGWVQVALYPGNKQLAIVVCDSGIGIPQSMRQAFPDLVSDFDALEKAIQKEVTSKPEFGQGNGLSGSVALAHDAHGYCRIVSGNAQLVIQDKRVKPIRNRRFFQGTIISLQIPIDKDISLAQSLWGHEPISYFELHFEDAAGNLQFRLQDFASSFGNRITGVKIRKLVDNLLTNYPTAAISIDFEGVTVISSSFADEVFGKIAVQLGVWQFGRRIKPKNINELCYTIIDRIVEQRISYKYKNDVDEVEFGSDNESL